MEVKESVLNGSFTGLESYKPSKTKATIAGVIDKVEKSKCSHYQALLKLLSFRADKPLNVKVIQECFDNGSQSNTSKRRYISSLRTLLPEYKKHFEITMGKDKKDTEKRDPFTDTEVSKMLDAFKDSKYLSFVKFQLMTGCRPSETIGLRWCDIELSENRIRIAHSIKRDTKQRKSTKTGKIRYFPLNSDLIELLSPTSAFPLISDPTPSENLVFTNGNNEMINSQTFRDLWEATLTRAGIRYRPPYAMRHTFISHCLARGVDVATVASWVGNSPEIIYKHYAGVINHSVVPSLYC